MTEPSLADRLTIHDPPPRPPCHVHVRPGGALLGGWTIGCDCGALRLPFTFPRVYGTREAATVAAIDHLRTGRREARPR